jgi:hypothetical protein
MLIHAGLHVLAKTSHHQAITKNIRQNINYICARIATLWQYAHICFTLFHINIHSFYKVWENISYLCRELKREFSIRDCSLLRVSISTLK